MTKRVNFAFGADDLPAGRYDVQVRKDGYWNIAVKSFLAPRESSAVLTISTDKRDMYMSAMSASAAAD